MVEADVIIVSSSDRLQDTPVSATLGDAGPSNPAPILESQDAQAPESQMTQTTTQTQSQLSLAEIRERQEQVALRIQQLEALRDIEEKERRLRAVIESARLRDRQRVQGVQETQEASAVPPSDDGSIEEVRREDIPFPSSPSCAQRLREGEGSKTNRISASERPSVASPSSRRGPPSERDFYSSSAISEDDLDGDYDTSNDEKHGKRRRAHHKVKVEDIPKFTESSSFVDRERWLANLQRAFAGDRRNLSSGKYRILFALEKMSEELRCQWTSYLQDLSREDGRAAARDWKLFRGWTLGLIQDPGDARATLERIYLRARQRDGQSPQRFHEYLRSLEEQMPRLPETKRTYDYYVRLLPALVKEIDRRADDRPETRLEMVKLASRIWNNMGFGEAKPKATTASKQERGDREPPPKRARTDNGRFRPHKSHTGRGQASGKASKDQESHRQSDGKNPIGSDGKRMRCHTCGSETHLANHCPEAKAKVTRNPAGSSATNQDAKNPDQPTPSASPTRPRGRGKGKTSE